MAEKNTENQTLTMKVEKDKIISWLFSTKAFQVCQPDQPFWYTSGTLGPFYINTHFLYGSESEAGRLLQLIDQNLDRPDVLIPAVIADSRKQYDENAHFRSLCSMLAGNLADLPCDLISGGERRDWFFSFQTAILLDKPHLTLLKNGQAYVNQSGQRDMSGGRIMQVEPGSLQKKIVIHVADLVTEASSYERAWLPAISRCGAAMPYTLVVVDRNQGGREHLASAGTELRALIKIDSDFFLAAMAAGMISRAQLTLIERYLADPDAFMDQFIKDHPDFLEQQIGSGGKNRERALRYIERTKSGGNG
jgi:hypothetical protein